MGEGSRPPRLLCPAGKARAPLTGRRVVSPAQGASQQGHAFPLPGRGPPCLAPRLPSLNCPLAPVPDPEPFPGGAERTPCPPAPRREGEGSAGPLIRWRNSVGDPTPGGHEDPPRCFSRGAPTGTGGSPWKGSEVAFSPDLPGTTNSEPIAIPSEISYPFTSTTNPLPAHQHCPDHRPSSLSHLPHTGRPGPALHGQEADGLRLDISSEDLLTQPRGAGPWSP